MTLKVWPALSNELAEAAATVGKCVVAVQQGRQPASGICWSNDVVVTVNHALRRDEGISVTWSEGDSVDARIAGRDRGTDLAVLCLQRSIKTRCNLGDPSRLRVGELVLALGRTQRGSIVASSGIVFDLRGAWRSWHGGRLDQFIRADLTFYPGFSGGPLVGPEGKILGMNTAGLHRSGVTVPTTTLERVIPDLLEKGRIERPYLGLSMQTVPLPESFRTKLSLTGSEALLVTHVEPDAAADKAGILMGDLLIDFDGHPLMDSESILEAWSGHAPGDSIQLRIIRGGEVRDATAVLRARPR